jgi:glycogen debranching enzyme
MAQRAQRDAEARQHDQHTPRRRATGTAVVAKDGDLFFLSDADGQVPLHGNHALGLYYHDCRFLDGYEFRVGGVTPDALLASGEEGFRSFFELTNPAVKSGSREIPEQQVGIGWERTIEVPRLALHDVITLHNFGADRLELPMTLTFASAFEDIFTVRGMPQGKRGTVQPAAWNDGTLRLAYDGADGVHRRLTVVCSPTPNDTEGTSARFRVTIDSGQSTRIVVTLVVAESDAADHEPRAAPPDHVRRVHTNLRRSADEWIESQPQVESDSAVLNRVLDRSRRDLRVLRSELRGQHFFAAGVPWYVTLFGRDSITAALQTLAFEPGIAESTLRLLASYQGDKVDEWRDEQPGKIPHELRTGEMAHLAEIPQTPYYGSIDATPLFLILLGRHAAWTGDLRLFNSLRPNVERALECIARSAHPTGNGYLTYETKSKKGLANQGWKDSGDAIMNADGSLATPPIALIEVQAYVYLAKVLLADLYRRAGDGQRGHTLTEEATTLRERFNQDFWLADRGFYALALQKDKTPAAVRSSNPGQALWCGIADPDKARRTVDDLMTAEMFSGWGIRTLSTDARRYNPIGYHLGTVWPHDNSLVGAGCRRYGADEAALRIFAGIVQAAAHFTHDRLPEVFAGFPREQFPSPVRSPVACHPQAWAAGAVPYLLETLLGLVPDAFAHRLHIQRAVLPDFVARLRLRRLKVGDAYAALEFKRRSDGTAAVDVLEVEGELEVVIDAAVTS